MRKAMGTGGLPVEPPPRHLSEHRLEIALLGPAYVSERIVAAFLLVFRIVTPRTVRTRYLEGQFLLVEIGARQFESANTDEDDATAFAGHPGGLAHRIAALRRCGDQD